MFNLFKKKNTRNFQNEFDTLISNFVIPILKENDFKKEGNNFARKTEDIIQAFNIQKSQSNSKDDISFTFNIGFFSEKIYERNPVPSFPKTYDCFLLIRSGHLMYGNDKWFQLNKDTNLIELEKEISRVMKEIVELFNAHKNLFSLKELMSKYGSVSPLTRIEFLALVNEKEEAEKKLQEAYKENLTPKPNTMVTRYPDGSEEETIFPNSGSGVFLERLKALADKYALKAE